MGEQTPPHHPVSVQIANSFLLTVLMCGITHDVYIYTQPSDRMEYFIINGPAFVHIQEQLNVEMEVQKLDITKGLLA